MSDFEDNDDGWSDYEGDDDGEDEQIDMANDAIDDLEENADWNDYEAVDSNAQAEPMAEQLVKIRKVLSLKENCLECITKNFERFNNAYLSSEDAVLRRNLEFLQRVYTSCVIHSLSSEGLLNDRHLEFLINEHLKEFHLKIFVGNGCTLKAIEKRIVLVGHGFLKVSFDTTWSDWEDDIPEFINITICHISNVKVLHILQHCNNIILKNISTFCIKLSELNIDYSSNVTSKGLEMLCKKHEEHQTECLIKVLSIEGIHVIDSAIIFLLNNMPYLEILNCSYLPIILHSIHKDDLKNNTLNNAKKYNLTKLDFLYGNNILEYHGRITKEDILHVWAEVCPNIKTICINLSTKNCLDMISHFPKLENLTVDNVIDTIKQRVDFNNFLKSNCIKIQNLQIEGFTLSISILIESCPKLKNLRLTDVQFQSLESNLTKDQSSDKRSLDSLRDLCLGGIKFSDQYAEDSATRILLSTPNLEKLSFEQCKFENSEMNTRLAKFCEDSTLQHLRFYNCNIDLALLESIILTCSSLVSLTIDSCETISYEDIFNLNQLKDTTRNFVQIVYCNDESEENSIYSNEEDLFDNYSDYYHDDDDDDEDYLWYDSDGNEC